MDIRQQAVFAEAEAQRQAAMIEQKATMIFASCYGAAFAAELAKSTEDPEGNVTVNIGRAHVLANQATVFAMQQMGFGPRQVNGG